MTQLDNIRLIHKCFKERYHELEYGGYLYMAKMKCEDRKGKIYVEGKGLIPLTRPDQIFPSYIFDLEGNLVDGKEIENAIYLWGANPTDH